MKDKKRTVSIDDKHAIVKHRERHLSYSSISCFMDCRRKYYWSGIRNLERLQVVMPFFIGNMIDLGVSLLFANDKNVIKKVLKKYEEDKQTLRGSMNLTIEQEQDLNEQREIIIGMLEAYKMVHAKEIKVLKHKYMQYEVIVPINTFDVKIKIDNIVESKKGLYLHELKTTRNLTPDYVKNIKNDFQTSIYYHLYNMSHKQKLEGIIYDVIQKPSIRQKQKESVQEFICRLKDWYKGVDNADKYYIETIKTPMISKDRVLNIITKVKEDIDRCTHIDDFYPNERFCYVYRRCDFYDICHEGEKPELMANFKLRGGDKGEDKKETKNSKKLLK